MNIGFNDLNVLFFWLLILNFILFYMIILVDCHDFFCKYVNNSRVSSLKKEKNLLSFFKIVTMYLLICLCFFVRIELFFNVLFFYFLIVLNVLMYRLGAQYRKNHNIEYSSNYFFYQTQYLSDWISGARETEKKWGVWLSLHILIVLFILIIFK